MSDVPFVQAKHFTDTGARGRTITCIVLHSVEVDEGTPDLAMRVALSFKAGQRVASAHRVFDNTRQVKCVMDKDVAYAAPGCNNDGLHYEHGGFARQTRAQWLDSYSTATLRLSARQAAEDCIRYGLRPDRYLTYLDLRAGRRQGITTHHQVTLAWHKTTHTDPGPEFPMDVYLGWVTAEYAALTGGQQGDLSMADAKTIMDLLGNVGMRVAGLQADVATIKADVAGIKETLRWLPNSLGIVQSLYDELLSHDDNPDTKDKIVRLRELLDTPAKLDQAVKDILAALPPRT